MPEYLMPTPISELKRLLNCYAKTKERWEESTAALDIMIDLDKGKLKPYRYYAKRWKWSISSVYKYLPEMKDRVKCMRSFDTQGEQAANMREQNTQLREQKSLFRTPKTQKRERSEFLRERTANSTIQNTDINTCVSKDTLSELHENLTEDGGKLTNAQKCQDAQKRWNEFAEKHGLPTIRKMTKKRKRWVCERYDDIIESWDDICAKILGWDFALGQVVASDGRTWKINFDYLWRNDDNWNRLLERVDEETEYDVDAYAREYLRSNNPVVDRELQKRRQSGTNIMNIISNGKNYHA